MQADPLEPYRSVRNGAGIVARDGVGTLAFTGGDRRSFLHALLTNDIAVLRPGTGCYAAYLTPQGRMITDMQVLELGDRVWMAVPRALTQVLARRFDDLIFSEDVQVADVTASLAVIGLHGPRAVVVAAAAIARSVPALPPPGALAPMVQELTEFARYQNRRVELAGGPVVIVRTDDFGETGFDLYVARENAEEFCDDLRTAGGKDVDAATAEVLRVEAGLPRFGVDMDETTIPLEAGLDERAISYTKGCYVGQEVIIRVLHRGHGRVVRRLVGLTLEPGSAVERGNAIRSGERELGHITSAVHSAALDRPIALGYVHRDFAEPEAHVSVRNGDREFRAIVTELPFVERDQRADSPA